MSDLAIKYSMMKKKKRMAEGGRAGGEGYGKYQEQAQSQKGVHTPVSGVAEYSKETKGTSRAGDYTKDRYGGKPTFSGSDHPAIKEHHKVLSEMKSMPKPNLKGLAEGGEVDEHIREREEHQKGVHKTGEIQGQARDRMYKSKAADSLAPGFGKSLHEEKLKELKMINPKLKGLADGGFVEEENMSGYVDHPEDEEMMNGPAEEEDDLVSRALKSRKNMYSEGGKVANEGEDEMSHMADSDPNEFDDLALEDDLKSSYTGANSGDELGDAQEDQDRDDIVSRVMASRRKKDRLPNPR